MLYGKLGSWKTTRDIAIEKLLLTSPGGSNSMPPGFHSGRQGRAQAERAAGPGHSAVLGSVGDMLWCSQAKATLVNSNQIKEFC